MLIIDEVECKHFQGRRVFTHFQKVIYSKRKEFAPKGSKFFPFREDPFSEAIWWAGKQNGSQKKTCLPAKKMAEHLPSVSNPLKESEILCGFI